MQVSPVQVFKIMRGKNGVMCIMKRTIAVLIMLVLSGCLWAVSPLSAQPADEGEKAAGEAAGDKGLSVEGKGKSASPMPQEDETHKKVLRYTLLFAAPTVTILYGAKAWDWGDNEKFRWGNEGWYGYNTCSGGADKTGHAYSHYIVQRWSYAIFDYTENGRATKWWYSIFTSAFIGTLIEVGDGFTGRYGFSKEDLIADYSGIALGVIMDRFPTFNAFVGFSGEYKPTNGFKRYPTNKTWLNFTGAYSGWKWMFNFKLAGFRYVGVKIPEFMRYIMLDVGYYTRNYTSYDNYVGNWEKRREWFYGVSVNMREVVKDLFTDQNSRLCWVAQQPFEYYHVPLGWKSAHAIDKNKEADYSEKSI